MAPVKCSLPDRHLAHTLSSSFFHWSRPKTNSVHSWEILTSLETVTCWLSVKPSHMEDLAPCLCPSCNKGCCQAFEQKCDLSLSPSCLISLWLVLLPESCPILPNTRLLDAFASFPICLLIQTSYCLHVLPTNNYVPPLAAGIFLPWIAWLLRFLYLP